MSAGEECRAVDELCYQLEPNLSAEDFVSLLERSGLAARRPVGDRQVIEGMLRHASIIMTARLPAKPEPEPEIEVGAERTGRLVGVARAISDFSYCTYLSDLAVDQAYQRRGIGRRLLELAHVAAGSQTTLILLAAPAAREYYPRLGMQRHDSCWITSKK
ncbi:MAG: GNAT family N-acetyltransferase [Aureliella sp.]